MLPKLPGAGCANAAVLNQRDAPIEPVRVADRRRDRRGWSRSCRSARRVGGRDRDREAALERGDAVHLPPADDRILHAGRVAGELLAACRTAGCRRSCRPRRWSTSKSDSPRSSSGSLLSSKPCQPLKPAAPMPGRGRLGVGALRPGVDERQHRARPRCSSLAFIEL